MTENHADLMDAIDPEDEIGCFVERLVKEECPGRESFVLDHIKEEIKDQDLSRRVSNAYCNLAGTSMRRAFEVGFVMGQMFDVTEPEVLARMNGLWKRIKEEKAA